MASKVVTHTTDPSLISVMPLKTSGFTLSLIVPRVLGFTLKNGIFLKAVEEDGLVGDRFKNKKICV